eukprot:8310530-Pyramimonas_sp.AAC.1
MRLIVSVRVIIGPRRISHACSGVSRNRACSSKRGEPSVLNGLANANIGGTLKLRLSRDKYDYTNQFCAGASTVCETETRNYMKKLW